MKKTVIINNQHLSLRSYNGQKVVTFKDIDSVHGRSEGTAHRNFKTNKKRFVEGVDFFRRNSSEAKKEFGISAPNGLILITESGYLMLAKSFTDDLAWQIQRELVNVYFRSSEKKSNPKSFPKNEQFTLETDEYYYFDKTYQGEPVITLADFEHITGIGVSTVRCRVKGVCKHGVDYLILKNAELVAFKVENPNIKRSIKSVFLLKKTAVEKLFKWYKTNSELPKCFIETKKKDIINAKEPKAPRKWKEPYADDFVITANTLMYMRSHAERVYEHNDHPEYAKKHIDSINDLMTYCGFFMSCDIFER